MRVRSICRAVVFACTAAFVVCVAPASAVDISSCRTVVPRGTDAQLVADLVCPSGAAVILESRAALYLSGHTITVDDGVAIGCVSGRCSVTGPGELVGQNDPGSVGIGLGPGGNLRARDVLVRGFGSGIAGGQRSKLGLERVTIEDSSTWGIHPGVRSRVTATDLTVTGTVGPTGRAVHATRCRGSHWKVSNNFATFGFNQSGVACGRARVDPLTATGNAGLGVHTAGAARLANATITGNDAGGQGIDIETGRPPNAPGIVCGKSSDGEVGNWGICAGD